MRLADETAISLGFEQHGVFARWQLTGRGIADDAIKTRVRSGRWVRHAPGVYGLPSHPPTFVQRLWIGWLGSGPGAIVSHEAAAELHRMPSVQRGQVVLTIPHSSFQRIPAATVHQISDIEQEHRTSMVGLPVTTVARTIVDLAAVVHPARLMHIVEDAKHANLVEYPEVGECLRSVARRGKPGVRALTRVLDSLTQTSGKAMSVLERELLALMYRAGLPPPVVQMPFPGRQLPASCVDVAYPEAKLVIEADGRAWHSRIADIKRDRERDAEAARNGWQTLRLLYEHIVDDPTGTAALIDEVRRTRLLQLAS
jgi:hypothetical protein